jgi:hypothetical protein
MELMNVAFFKCFTIFATRGIQSKRCHAREIRAFVALPTDELANLAFALLPYQTPGLAR